MEIMKEMAKVVDLQNKEDKKYIKMSNDYERSLAFQTACDLIFKGKDQPSGYTEPLLHLNRLKKKINQN
jgi:malate synthase